MGIPLLRKPSANSGADRPVIPAPVGVGRTWNDSTAAVGERLKACRSLIAWVPVCASKAAGFVPHSPTSSLRTLSPTDSWLPVCNWLRSTEATFALRGVVSFSSGSVVPRNSPCAKRCSGSHFSSTPRVLIARHHALLNWKVCDTLSGPHRPARQHRRRSPFRPIIVSTVGRRSRFVKGCRTPALNRRSVSGSPGLNGQVSYNP